MKRHKSCFVTYNKHLIGEALKYNRKEILKLGLDRFSMLSGLSKRQILDIEKARTNYTIETFLHYLCHAGMPFDILMLKKTL